MGHINEPKGVDFIIKSKPLTDEERNAISLFIKLEKEKYKVADLVIDKIKEFLKVQENLQNFEKCSRLIEVSKNLEKFIKMELPFQAIRKDYQEGTRLISEDIDQKLGKAGKLKKQS